MTRKQRKYVTLDDLNYAKAELARGASTDELMRALNVSKSTIARIRAGFEGRPEAAGKRIWGQIRTAHGVEPVARKKTHSAKGFSDSINELEAKTHQIDALLTVVLNKVNNLNDKL